MRALDFHSEFDVVINLFSSFGYFKSQAEDRKVIRGVFRALKPRGKFLIDNMSGDFLEASFVAQSWSQLSDGTLILENRKPMAKSIAETHWIFVSPQGKRTTMHSKIRAYRFKELRTLIKNAGFSKVIRKPALIGNTKVTKTMMRLVLVGQK